MGYRNFIRKSKKGSFTVEAALIMPMILGVTVLFLYGAMYAHDRCVIEYACEVGAQKAVYEDDPGTMAVEKADSVLNEQLILSWDSNISVHEDENTVEVRIDAATTLFNRIFSHNAKAFKHFCPKY